VVHADGHQQPADPGSVQQNRADAFEVVLHGLQSVAEHGRRARVLRGRGLFLVRDQVGLQDDAQRLVGGPNLVFDCGD
jgi:hypothetical protein